MGHKVPFVPAGRCAGCRFSAPVRKNHWQAKYHKLVCWRFPPTGATNAPGDGPWSHQSFVQDSDYCAEWKPE